MALSWAFGSWATGDPVNTIEVTPPSHSDGDLLVGFVFIDDNQNITCPETGWTEDLEAQSSFGSDSAVATYYRIASSEPATITFNRAGTTGYCAGVIAKVTGFDSGTPIDATSQSAVDQIDSDTHDPAAITTVTDNAAVFVLIGANQATASGGAPSGYTLETSVGTVDAAIVCSKTVTSAGSEDPGTSSGWGSTADHGSITMAIRPSSAVSGGSWYYFASS